MKRAFKIEFSRNGECASYQLWYLENERPESVIRSGPWTHFLRKDGSELTFESVHMDKLGYTGAEWAEEIGAEFSLEEVTRVLPPKGR